MGEIVFKNGSTVKTEECANTIRGQRADIEPFYYEPVSRLGNKAIDEVLSKFMNKDANVDEDVLVYVSSEIKDFKVGDRVKVVDILKNDFMCGTPDSPYAYKNKYGTAVKVGDTWSYDVEVRMDIDGQVVCFMHAELELVGSKK